jgi:hypothetical protein
MLAVMESAAGELLRAVDDAGPGLRHVIIDLLPVTSIDATGLLTVTELGEALTREGSGSMPPAA